ncbi:MAG: hypothetical protein NC818_07345 [Candidatus Omnitrophica bacterium]|nr:hypothetical protein [Candidatus Omnitrophota bacterium]
MRKNKHCLKCCVIGVTLIELMLVLVIIAVVGMAITGRMLSGIEKAKVLAAGRQLVSHIRLAQERAKLEQRNITCEFDATNETYKIYQAGLNFDGNDYVSIATSASIDPSGGMGGITLEAWVKPSANTGNWQVVAMKGSTDAEIDYKTETGEFRLGVTNTSGTGVVFNISSGITTGSWYHLVMTYDGALIKGYVNGSFQSSQSQTGNVRSSGTGMLLGQYASSYYINGLISEVRIYNRALTQEEIQYSYTYKKPQNRAGLVGWWKLDEGQGTTAYDSSGYGNNGTINGATWAQGVIGYLKDPAKGYQDINYDFDNLSEFKGVKISSVDFDGSTITNSSKFSFDSSGRSKVGTENLSANGTIVLSCGNHTLTITVNRVTGEVTIE